MTNPIQSQSLSLQQVPASSIEEVLPQEILCHIFSFLNPSDLQEAAYCSKTFNATVIEAARDRCWHAAIRFSKFACSILKSEEVESKRILDMLCEYAKIKITASNLGELQNGIYSQKNQLARILSQSNLETLERVINPLPRVWPKKDYFKPVLFLAAQKAQIARALTLEGPQEVSSALLETVRRYSSLGHIHDACFAADLIPVRLSKSLAFRGIALKCAELKRYKQAFEMIEFIPNNQTKAYTLIRIAEPFFSYTGFQEAYIQEIFQKINLLTPIEGQDQSLSHLASRLIDESQLEFALRFSLLISDSFYRDELLKRIALLLLNSNQFERGLVIANQIDNSRDQSDLRNGMVTALIEQGQIQLALQVYDTITTQGTKASCLLDILRSVLHDKSCSQELLMTVVEKLSTLDLGHLSLAAGFLAYNGQLPVAIEIAHQPNRSAHKESILMHIVHIGKLNGKFDQAIEAASFITEPSVKTRALKDIVFWIAQSRNMSRAQRELDTVIQAMCHLDEREKMEELKNLQTDLELFNLDELAEKVADELEWAQLVSDYKKGCSIL